MPETHDAPDPERVASFIEDVYPDVYDFLSSVGSTLNVHGRKLVATVTATGEIMNALGHRLDEMGRDPRFKDFLRIVQNGGIPIPRVDQSHLIATPPPIDEEHEDDPPTSPARPLGFDI